jgi:hypothetical protein
VSFNQDHPQEDGLDEVIEHVLGPAIRCFMAAQTQAAKSFGEVQSGSQAPLQARACMRIAPLQWTSMDRCSGS